MTSNDIILRKKCRSDHGENEYRKIILEYIHKRWILNLI